MQVVKMRYEAIKSSFKITIVIIEYHILMFEFYFRFTPLAYCKFTHTYYDALTPQKEVESPYT